MSEPVFPAGNLPDLWGEGATFAFSGLDGPTNSSSGFAATLGVERYSLLWHTPLRRLLQIRVPTLDSPLLVTGDTIVAETQAGDLFISFASWHTVVGLAPAHTGVRLILEDGTPAEVRGNVMVSIDPQGRDALALLVQGPLFVLSYGRTPDEAIARANTGLAADLNQIAQDRLRIFAEVPSLPDDPQDRLLRECLSVMKANTLSAEGGIRQLWSTPDRVARPGLWPRESVFQALAINRIYPGVAWQLLKSVLDAQNADGMIPQFSSPDGWKSAITHPPLLAWGVWENYQRLHDRMLIEYAFPRLEDYIDWCTSHRDRNRNGLLEWAIDDDPARRSTESGMDTSPRFDEGVLLDAVDFSVFAAREMCFIAKIAMELGHTDDARYWQDKADYTSLKVHERLWDERDAFYYDAHMDGTPSRVASAAGFMPLLLDNLPAGRAERMGSKLKDPAIFNTAGMNHLIILGLAQHARYAEADCLRAATIDRVRMLWEKHGAFDGAWTAAATACLLMQHPQSP